MIKYLWALRAMLYNFYFNKVGKFSYIGKPLFIYGAKKITLGERVRIYPHVRLETHGSGEIIIGNNVSVGQNLHMSAGMKMYIGDNTTISSNVLITDIDHNFSELDIHIMEQSLIIKETKIGNNCFIGSGAKILPGTVLGKQCIVGANSVVKGVFPEYCVIAGAPAKIIKQYDFNLNRWIGVKNNGFSDSTNV